MDDNIKGQIVAVTYLLQLKDHQSDTHMKNALENENENLLVHCRMMLH